jgi:excisionase family DNA binding protein
MVASKNSENGGVRKIRSLADHPEPYVTTSDLAEYWVVSRKLIYKQIEAGTLKAIRLGPRLMRISTRDAIEFEKLAKMTPPNAIGDRYRSSDTDPPERNRSEPAGNGGRNVQPPDSTRHRSGKDPDKRPGRGAKSR